MSTRSGKRIHSSLHENNLRTEVEVALKSERKTRSKHLKENIDDASIILEKFKKRENYVSYPTDDEQPGDGGIIIENEGKHTRTLRKNALKELNPTIPTDISKSEVPLKNSRSTRRTRKFAEITTDASENVEIKDPVESVEKITKKSKRKKVSTESTEPPKPAKKKNKKKKGKGSESFVTEITEAEDNNTDVVNKSNMSVDSFHSAAGSPCHGNNAVKISQTENITQMTLYENNQKKKSNKKVKKNVGSKLTTSEDNSISENKDNFEKKNGTFEIEHPKRHSSIRLACIDEKDSVTRNSISLIDLNITKDKNDTFDLEKRKSGKKSSITNVGIDELDSVQKNKKCHPNISLSGVNISQNKNETFDMEKTFDNRNRTSITYAGIVDTSSVNINNSKEMNSNDTQNNNTFEIESLDKKDDCTTKIVNTTYEKDSSVSSASKSRKRKSTMDVNSDILSLIDDQRRDKTSSLNSTYDKDMSTKVNITFELKDSPNKTKKFLETFGKDIESPRRKIRKSGNMINSNRRSSDIQNSLAQCLNTTFEATKDNTGSLNGIFNISEKINTTFDKEQNLNTTFDKISKSSLISSDSNNDISRISITSDESITEPKPIQKPTIMNVTPVLIDSSIDDSLISEESKSDILPLKREGTFSLSGDEAIAEAVPTPLKREGTFTKDGPDDPSVNKESPPVTPRKNVSLPSPGCTPFPNKSFSKEKPLLNVTRSIEKKRSIEPALRITRVMFCSPVNNPVVVAQQKRTVIKSNLKGSNKSFVYEECVDTPSSLRPSRRKRSHTHSEADEAHHKRKRLTDDLRQSVDRLSRPRTSSANAKLVDSTPSIKPTTPSKAKVPRTKLPNFAALHQKQFDKMESLDECQERKAKRARQLLTATPGAASDRSPKVNADSPARHKEVVKKADNLTKSFTQEASKQKYTRFGFKLNLDVNPFSIPGKNPVKPKEQLNGLKRQATLPSLTGATSVRREVAKQVVMREKSFSDKRLLKRNENRTIIKGVRTNRRFELQMKLRNIE